MAIGLICFGCNQNGTTISDPTETSSHVRQLLELGAAYESDDEIDSSLSVYLLALQNVDTLGSFNDQVFVLGQLGKLYLYQKGNLPKAEEHLIKQRDLLEKGDAVDTKLKVRNYLDLSFLYFKKQDFPYAESYSMMAYLASHEQEFTDSLLQSQIFSSLGSIKNQVLDTIQAMPLFKKASQYYPLNNSKPERKHPWIVGYINYYNNFGPSDSAVFWLHQFKIQSGEDKGGLAEYERLYSIFYLLRGDYSESIRHSRQSIEYYHLCKNPDPFNSLHSYILLSSALQATKAHDEALVYLDSALVKKFGPAYTLADLQSDIFSLSTLATKAEIVGDQGIHLRDTHLIHDALAIYDTLELLLTHFTKFDIDGFLANKFYNNYYYTKLMELYAFMYAETNTDRWLHHIHNTITSYKAQAFSREKVLSDLSKSIVGNNAAFQKFVRNDFQLEKLIFEINQLSFQDKAKRAKELNSFLREKINIRNKLEEDHPDLFQQIVSIRNISPEELLAYSIENNSAFINYYIGDRFYNPDKIYVLLVVKGEFLFYTLRNDFELFDMIDSLYLLHKSPSDQEESYIISGYREMSHHVYNRLVRDIYPRIRDAKEVIIIPDEKLHHLAFDALVMKLPENANLKWDQTIDSYFLIDSLNISYAYSPNRFIAESPLPHEYKLSVLGMGFSDKETIGKRRLESLAELRSSYLELETIKKYYHDEKAKYFTGFDCTKSNFFKYAPVSKLIHLSTHGGYIAEFRNSSMLYLSEGKSISKMYQHELRFADICPEILILSACDSGAGKLSAEEGMMSIGRIFQAYGTKNVISALWPLTDRASTDLFNTFYEHYSKDIEANAALRHAKLKMLHSKSDFHFPGYWASLILYN